jgi:hypothetical protein
LFEHQEKVNLLTLDMNGILPALLNAQRKQKKSIVKTDEWLKIQQEQKLKQEKVTINITNTR